jgi:hypothetical protein
MRACKLLIFRRDVGPILWIAEQGTNPTKQGLNLTEQGIKSIEQGAASVTAVYCCATATSLAPSAPHFSAFYAPERERGVRWHDSRFGIKWQSMWCNAMERQPDLAYRE